MKIYCGNILDQLEFQNILFKVVELDTIVWANLSIKCHF